ncbi:type VII secretion protein EccE [Mycobacterium sp. M1]|uniref:Type VII secretion protein EccE n=1 Tax=Mycolicibacter acidiphilus TaxID=2835306 RepID=A0ABS5RH45_9MYCO|nr:type VII secretion protein EccE [Mycolicibacter acidiphilus]MBS9532776.1 type VII secretion protein EccE [Mycolicibacter acidiphilus]
MNSTWVGLRFTTGHLLTATLLGPALIAAGYAWGKPWVGITLTVLAALIAVVTVRGRRLTGWIAALWAWRRRHKTAPPAPSEPVVGQTVMPGDHVAMRWTGEELEAAIELIPRPFTPTVIVDGHATTDDTIDTRLVERLLSAHCPELVADVVSAGYRVGRSAPPNLVGLYEQVMGPNPAPAHRRTWIILRANPEACRKSAQRRADGVSGLARYLVSSTTRMADQLASHGVDARCARSFDDYDRATEISFENETWSVIKGRSTFTTAYTAAGGPDVWWSVRADHTITRVRIALGAAPQSTVLLTTLATPKTPHGFSCLYGGQRAALSGLTPVSDRHYQLPIGSAGVLIGETGQRFPVYMPFDDVDSAINLGDARLFTQFVVRAAAAGAQVVLGQQFGEFASAVNGRVGQTARVMWPNATTYLTPHQGVDRVLLRDNFIGTPRHRQLPIRLIEPREESRYQMALER